jgi:hypothetical protein
MHLGPVLSSGPLKVESFLSRRQQRSDISKRGLRFQRHLTSWWWFESIREGTQANSQQRKGTSDLQPQGTESCKQPEWTWRPILLQSLWKGTRSFWHLDFSLVRPWAEDSTKPTKFVVNHYGSTRKWSYPHITKLWEDSKPRQYLCSSQVGCIPLPTAG